MWYYLPRISDIFDLGWPVETYTACVFDIWTLNSGEKVELTNISLIDTLIASNHLKKSGYKWWILNPYPLCARENVLHSQQDINMSVETPLLTPTAARFAQSVNARQWRMCVCVWKRNTWKCIFLFLAIFFCSGSLCSGAVLYTTTHIIRCRPHNCRILFKGGRGVVATNTRCEWAFKSPHPSPLHLCHLHTRQHTRNTNTKREVCQTNLKRRRRRDDTMRKGVGFVWGLGNSQFWSERIYTIRWTCVMVVMGMLMMILANLWAPRQVQGGWRRTQWKRWSFNYYSIYI